MQKWYTKRFLRVKVNLEVFKMLYVIGCKKELEMILWTI